MLVQSCALSPVTSQSDPAFGACTRFCSALPIKHVCSLDSAPVPCLHEWGAPMCCRFHTDPSGTFTKYGAYAIGSGSEGAQTALQEGYRCAAPSRCMQRPPQPGIPAIYMVEPVTLSWELSWCRSGAWEFVFLISSVCFVDQHLPLLCR